MSIPLASIVEGIDPVNTVLFFGAGSSIPSGVPSVTKLIDKIGKEFQIDIDGYSLTEIASIAEQQKSRAELIQSLRPMFNKIHITGSLLNLPLYNWKNIYTTNYDKHIERGRVINTKLLFDQAIYKKQ